MRWRGHTVCILASGPSLTVEDATTARLRADRVIAINEAWRLCPDADVLYGADSNWWQHRAPAPEDFAGERWTQHAQWAKPYPSDMQIIRSQPGEKIAPPGSDFVFTGHNSSYQALGLAVIWGATRIVFLGLDLSVAPDGLNHFHGDYPAPVRNVRTSYPTFIQAFNKAAPVLAGLGVTVVNASRRTALEAYPRMTLTDAFDEFHRQDRGIPIRAVDPARQAEIDYFFDPDGDGDL